MYKPVMDCRPPRDFGLLVPSLSTRHGLPRCRCFGLCFEATATGCKQLSASPFFPIFPLLRQFEENLIDKDSKP